jgi:hypothetical protein
MRQSTDKSVPETLANETVVDADVHVSPPLDEIAEYLDEPYKSTISDPGYGAPMPSPTWDINRGGKIESEPVTHLDDVEKFSNDFSIDRPIANSLKPYYSNLPTDDLAARLLPAYNDWLLAELDKHPNMLAFAGLDPQNPDKTAEELDRIGDEKQIVGGLFMNTGPNPPLGDPEYDIIFQAAEDNNLAIVFHAAAGSSLKYEFPRQDESIREFVTAHTLTHLWCHTLTLSSLIVQGVPVKFPDIDFVFLEAGLGWVPYMMHRLNKEISIRQSEAPLLEKSPEEYIRESFYFASQPIGEPNNPADLEQIMDLIGAESVMFASDYPHWDFDHPDAFDQHLRRRFSENERSKVLSGNAEEVFNVSS